MQAIDKYLQVEAHSLESVAVFAIRGIPVKAREPQYATECFSGLQERLEKDARRCAQEPEGSSATKSAEEEEVMGWSLCPTPAPASVQDASGAAKAAEEAVVVGPHLATGEPVVEAASGSSQNKRSLRLPIRQQRR
jgi:hypothetical protein